MPWINEKKYSKLKFYELSFFLLIAACIILFLSGITIGLLQYKQQKECIQLNCLDQKTLNLFCSRHGYDIGAYATWQGVLNCYRKNVSIYESKIFTVNIKNICEEIEN